MHQRPAVPYDAWERRWYLAAHARLRREYTDSATGSKAPRACGDEGA